jgi:hypothetical protein
MKILSGRHPENLYADRLAPQAPEYCDIFLHLPVLRHYAAKCAHVTEFGVRTGNSRIALLCGLMDAGGGELVGYDINTDVFPRDWPELEGVRQTLHKADTAKLESIEPTDLLFIDSCHQTEHIRAELTYAKSVRRWIIMHDTSADWSRLGGPGPITARDEFLSENHEEWALTYCTQKCEGLSVLSRRNQT